MNCEKCGSELEENAKFCTECGNAVNADNGDSRVWECPGCSEQFTEEVIYCPKCGTKIAEKDWKSGLKTLGVLAAGMLIGSLGKKK